MPYEPTPEQVDQIWANLDDDRRQYLRYRAAVFELADRGVFLWEDPACLIHGRSAYPIGGGACSCIGKASLPIKWQP